MKPTPPLAALRARRPDPLRVLLVQLPIQELVFRRVRGNELVAPGYLKASMEKSLGARVEVEILPRALVDRLGDAALAQAIAAREPDVVGFSLFLWNSARSVALAARVKELLPDSVVVVGGPEVTRDNPWCVTAPGIDVGVVGEGERTLEELLRWTLGEGPAALELMRGLALPPLDSLRSDPVRYTEARPAIELSLNRFARASAYENWLAKAEAQALAAAVCVADELPAPAGLSLDDLLPFVILPTA